MSAGHEHGSGKCKEIFARLSEYIDGELPADLCERIDGHMGDCPPCQAFLRSLEGTVRLVEDVESPAMPDDVRRSLREAFERFKGDAQGGAKNVGPDR